MMSDMLVLRLLSMSGSMCGMVYNFTRTPPQREAVAWGLIFFSVNAVNVVRLFMERKEIKFTPEEYQLYADHFEEFSVPPHEFAKLVELGHWEKRSDGEVIQQKGEPNYSIIMLNRGTVAAFGENGDTAPKWTYGAGVDGAVIGGTALADQSVLGRPYPNQLRAKGDVEYIVWEVKELAALLKKDRLLESAFIHSLYIDLIEGLRRFRKESTLQPQTSGSAPSPSKEALELSAEETESVGNKLQQYQQMLTEALTAGEEQGVIPPERKRKVMRFAAEKGVTRRQRATVLASFGWTEEDWLVGARNAPVDTPPLISICISGGGRAEPAGKLT